MPHRLTFVPRELREEYLAGLAASDFAPHTYDLFRHNCNTFSATYSEFLTGNSIPVSELPCAVHGCLRHLQPSILPSVCRSHMLFISPPAPAVTCV